MQHPRRTRTKRQQAQALGHPLGTTRVLSPAPLAAPDQVDDFEAVAGRDGGGVPLGSRQEMEVSLDGHAIG